MSRAADVLGAYETLARDGVAPTQREVAEATGLSLAGVHYHLDGLERTGRVRRTRSRARSVTVTLAPREAMRAAALADLDATEGDGAERFAELLRATFECDPAGTIDAILRAAQLAELTDAGIDAMGNRRRTVLARLIGWADEATT